MTPTLSIVVPAYNAADTLERCLTALGAALGDRQDCEIIVVDDGSTDCTAELAGRFPVRLLRHAHNQGRIRARDTGASAARAGLLLFVDARIVVPPEALRLLESLEYEPVMAGTAVLNVQDGTALDRLLFLLRTRLYAPYYPQSAAWPRLWLTPQHFDRVPKGMGFFAIRRERFLAALPAERSADVSDDTRLFRTLVQHKPILVAQALQPVYLQRQRPMAAYYHIFERGPLFADYYLRPGGRYYRHWWCCCLAAVAALGGLVMLPQLAWGLGALAVLSLVSSSAWLAAGWSDFWRLLGVLPVVAGLFGLGLIKGQSWRLLRQWRALPRSNLAVVLLFATVVLSLYGHILSAPFVYDDVSFRDNAAVQVHTLSALLHALLPGQQDRWLGYWTFAVNFYLGGLDPSGYHLTNVLVHIANGWLVFWLIATTLVLSRSRTGESDWTAPAGARQVALFAALLWLVHPVQTQAVTYVVQRLASLSALLCLASGAAYIVGRQRAGRQRYACYGLSLLAWLLAMGVKQNAAVLPVLLFVYDLYFFHAAPWPALRRRWPWLLVLGVGGTGLAVLVFGPDVWGALARRYAGREFSMAERLLTEARVVLYYLSLLVLPHPSRLRVDYDFPISTSLWQPLSTGVATAAILLSGAWAIAAASRQRLLSFAILWFFGHLLIESTLIPLDLVYEHRLYLPSLGPLSALTVGLFRGLAARPAWLSPVLCTAIALTLAVWTYQRNAVWTSPVRLWTDNAQKAPGKARVHANLGKALLDAGHPAAAAAAFEQALALNPSLLGAYSNLAVINIEHWHRYDRARAYLHAALAINPRYPEAHLNLGVIALHQGDLVAAIAAFTEVLRLRPSHLLAHYNLAACYINQRDFQPALAVLDHGLAYWPAAPRLHLLKGRTYQLLKKLPEARRSLARAYALQPHDPEVQRYYEQVKQ